MKLTRKLLLPFAILTMIFGFAGVSSAQQQTFCLGLNEADCAQYLDIVENSTFPTSTGFEATIAGDFVVPETPPITFSVDLNGAYSFDAASAEAAGATFAAVPLLDVSLRDVLTVIDETVSAWDAELFIDLSGIPQVAPFVAGAEPVGLWLVDGVAYVDLSLVSTLLGDPSFDGVFGIDAFEALELALSSITMGDLAPEGDMGDFDLSDFDMDEFTEAFTEGFEQGFNNAAMGAELTEEELAMFATQTRIADDELFIIQTEIDFAQIFTIEIFREQFITQLEQQADMDMGMDMDAEALLDALVEAFEGSTMVVTEAYDPASNYLVSTSFTMDATVDVSVLAAALDDTTVPEGTIVTVDVTMDFERVNIDGVDAIILPDNAQVVPTSALLGGF